RRSLGYHRNSCVVLRTANDAGGLNPGCLKRSKGSFSKHLGADFGDHRGARSKPRDAGGDIGRRPARLSEIGKAGRRGERHEVDYELAECSHVTGHQRFSLVKSATKSSANALTAS